MGAGRYDVVAGGDGCGCPAQHGEQVAAVGLAGDGPLRAHLRAEPPVADGGQGGDAVEALYGRGHGRCRQLPSQSCHRTNVPRGFYDATLYTDGMQRTSFEDMNCSVAQCLEVVGEWWSLLIVRDAFLGVTRFDQFQERLGISRNILKQRLENLTDHGVLEKVPYSDHPPRHEYRLTAKAQDLRPAVTTIRKWGDKYAAPDGPPIHPLHEAGGPAFNPEITSSTSGHRFPPTTAPVAP